MSFTPDFLLSDYQRMSQAIQLARKGWYTCMPNPRVGCVLDKEGVVIGEGWHYRAGENHAEVNALNQAGSNAKGATAYVTLEPCSHYGRTPPCAEALIDAGISKVIVGMQDPNPQVAGRGIAMLEKAGIYVKSGLMEEEVRALNPGFIHRMETSRPWVRCKMAMSLDGRTAMNSGESQWITGPDARADVQRLRGQSCAVITGIGTILHDNPSMTFRANEAKLTTGNLLPGRQPLRVIADSRLRTPVDAEVFTRPGRVLIACATVSEHARQIFLNKVQAFRKDNLPCGACDDIHGENLTEVVELPGSNGQVDFFALLQLLGQRECNNVLLETGARLAGSAIEANCIDELWIYMATVLMGSSARPLFSLPFNLMAERKLLKLHDIRAVGRDWRFIATFANADSSS